MTAVLLLHVLATLTMLGVIWTVQIVHYPLFAHTGPDEWPIFKSEHERRITWVVGPTMVAELVTAIALVFVPTAGIPAALPLLGVALVGVIWASTAFVQVPLHAALDRGFDAAVHRRLVQTNWIRTIAWTLRAAIVMTMLGRLA